jgi:hypothetical protein
MEDKSCWNAVNTLETASITAEWSRLTPCRRRSAEQAAEQSRFACAHLAGPGDFEVERRGLSCLARLVWRDQNTAGLMFSEEREMGDVVSLDWARKLRASERTNRRLRSRLDQILSEH